MCESVSESVTISDLEIAIASPSFASLFATEHVPWCIKDIQMEAP